MATSNNSDGPVSLVISILPAAVQSRLPPLHSVRRTVGRLAIRTVTAGATSILGVGVGVGAGAPGSQKQRACQQASKTRSGALLHRHEDKLSANPVSHAVSETTRSAALVGVETMDVDVDVDETGGADGHHANMGVALRKRRMGASRSTRRVALSEGSVVEKVPEEAVEEVRHCPKDSGEVLRLGLSGVDWRYGSRGFQLLRQAKDEALISWRRRGNGDGGDKDGSSPYDQGSDGQDEDDASLERKLFVDGLTYTLKALPHDLDDDELRAIQASLSAVNAPSMARPLAHKKASNNGRSLVQASSSPRQEPRSLLHRIVQILVSHLVVLVHVLFRYLVPLLQGLPLHLHGETETEAGAGAGTDTENGPRRLLGIGLELVGMLGKHGASLTARAMDQLGDGRAGHVVADGLAWAAEGVVGGLADGVTDGLGMVACTGGVREREGARDAVTKRRRGLR